MDRRLKALVGIMIVVVASVGFLAFMNPWRTEFHYRVAHTDVGQTETKLYIRHLKDCNVTISFLNDSSLLFDVSVRLYSPTDSVSFIEWRENIWKIEGSGRQERVDIVLGTAVAHDVVLQGGEALNTTITIENGAVLGGQVWKVYQTGIVRYSFREQNGLDIRSDFGVQIGSSEYRPVTLLDIDLPDSMDGELLAGDSPISFVAISGWYSRGDGTYSTATHEGNHEFAIGCTCTSVLARLID